MPERFEIYTVYKRRYINTLPFLFLFSVASSRRGRSSMAWMDVNTWTGLPVEESIRMTKDRDKWRKYVHGVVNFQFKDG